MKRILFLVAWLFSLIWFVFAVNRVFATVVPLEHQFGAGWHLLSFPGNPSATSVAGAFKDTQGKFIPISGNLIGWDRLNQKAVTYDASNPVSFFNNTIDHSHGYWLRLDSPTTLRFNMYKVTEPVKTDLSPGLNIIGYPFETSQSTANLSFKDKATRETKTMAEARDAGWISSILYAWDSEHQGLEYVSGLEDDFVVWTDLEPWHGYWLESFKDNLELIIPQPEAKR